MTKKEKELLKEIHEAISHLQLEMAEISITLKLLYKNLMGMVEINDISTPEE